MVNAYFGSYCLCCFSFHGVHPIVLLRVNFGMYIAVECAAFNGEFDRSFLCFLAEHVLILVHHVIYYLLRCSKQLYSVTEDCFHAALVTVSANTRELHLPRVCCVSVFAGFRLLSLSAYLCLVAGKSVAKHCARKWIFPTLIKLSYESCCLIAQPVHASVPEEPLLYPEDGDGVFLLNVTTCRPNYTVPHSNRQ